MDKVEKEMYLCRDGNNGRYSHLIRLLALKPFFHKHKKDEVFAADGTSSDFGQLHENIGVGGEVSKFLPYVEQGKCYKVKVTFEVVDGQDINFDGSSNADYFKQLYLKLGYEVIVDDTYYKRKENDLL